MKANWKDKIWLGLVFIAMIAVLSIALNDEFQRNKVVQTKGAPNDILRVEASQR